MIFQLIFYYFLVKFCCGDLTLKDIQLKIDDYNAKEFILNEDIYGPLTNESIVVIIQVHNRIKYLGYAIESHSKAKGIEDTLLIFSHDYYDDKINDLIQSITFCKVMQIFYPYSHQLYPFEYSRNPTSCEKCAKTKPSLMQVKHHWWWKINQLFTHLFSTKYFKGLVVFLEEDHYVLEDYLYTIKLMELKCEQLNCSFFSLTGYDNFRPREDKILNVAISKFPTSTGLVFNRTTWELIRNCGDKFCQINDYNWDWSLLHLIKGKCIYYPKILLSLTPRVLHIGNCINVSSSSDSDSELDISLRTRCNKLKELLSQKTPERVRLKDLAKDRRKSFHFRKSLVHAAVCEFVENQEQQQTPVDENRNCNVEDLSANTRRRRFLTSSTPLVSNDIARFSSGDVSSINETDSENSKKDAGKEEGRSVQKSDKNQTKDTPEIISINNSTDSYIKRLEASANINRTPRRRDKENSTNVTRQTDEVPEREKSKDNEAGDLQESNKNISGRSLRSRGKNMVEAVVEKLQVSSNVTKTSKNNSINVSNSKNRSLRNVTNTSKSGKVVNNNETLKRSVSTTPKGLRKSVLNNNHRRSRSLNVEKVCEVIPESDEDFDWPISISGVQKISRNVTATKDPESSDSSTGSNSALCHTNYLYESLERGPMEIPSPKPWRCDFSNSNARESLSLGFTKISVNPIEERRTYTRGRKKSVYGRSKNNESTKESKLLNIISRLSLMKESSSIESSDEDNCPPKTKNDVQNNNSRSRTVGNISQQKDQTPDQRDSPQNKSVKTPQKNKSTNKKKVVSSRTPHRDKSSNKNDDVANHRNSSRTPWRSTQKDEGSRMSLRSPHKENSSSRIPSKSPTPKTPKKSLRSPHKENSSPRIASKSPLSKTPKKSLKSPHKDNSSSKIASRSRSPHKENCSPRIASKSPLSKTPKKSLRTPHKDNSSSKIASRSRSPHKENSSPRIASKSPLSKPPKKSLRTPHKDNSSSKIASRSRSPHKENCSRSPPPNLPKMILRSPHKENSSSKIASRSRSPYKENRSRSPHKENSSPRIASKSPLSKTLKKSLRTPHKDNSSSKIASRSRSHHKENCSRSPPPTTPKKSLRSPHKDNSSSKIASRSRSPHKENSARSPHKENSSPRTTSKSPLSKTPKKSLRTPHKDNSSSKIASRSRSPHKENSSSKIASRSRSPYKENRSRSPHKENSSPRISSKSPLSKPQKNSLRTPHKENSSPRITSNSPPPNSPKNSLRSPHGSSRIASKSPTPKLPKKNLRSRKENSSSRIASRSPPKRSLRSSHKENNSTRIASRSRSPHKENCSRSPPPNTPKKSLRTPHKDNSSSKIASRSRSPYKENRSRSPHKENSFPRISSKSPLSKPQKNSLGTPHKENSSPRTTSNSPPPNSPKKSVKSPHGSSRIASKSPTPKLPKKNLRSRKENSSSRIASRSPPKRSLRSSHKENNSTRIATRSRSPHKENSSRSPPPNTPKKSLESPHKESSSLRTASRSPLSKTPKKTPQQKKDSSSKRLKTVEIHHIHVFSPVRKNLFNTPVKAGTSTSNHELPNSDTCVSDVIENIPPLIEYLQLSPRSDKTTQKNMTMDKNTTTEKQNKDIVKDQSKESNSSSSTSGVRIRGKRLQEEVDASIKMPPPKTKPKPRSRKAQTIVNTEEDIITSTTNSGEINESPQVRRSGRTRRPPEHRYKLEVVWLVNNKKQRNNKSTKKKITKALQNTLNAGPAQSSSVSRNELLNHSNILNITDKNNKSPTTRSVNVEENVSMVKKGTGVTHDTHGFVRIKPNSEKLTELHQKHDLNFVALSGYGETIVNNVVSEISGDKRSMFEVPTGMRYLIKNTSHEDDLELFYFTRPIY